MRLNILSIISTAFAVMLAGCNDDELLPNGIGDDASSPLQFSVSPFSVSNGEDSRSAEPSDNPEQESEQEKAIRDFWLFQFNTDGTELAAPAYYSIPTDGATLKEVTTKAYAALTQNTPMTIYVVANTGNATWVTGDGFNTLDKVKEQRLSQPIPIRVEASNSGVADPFYIPMSGELSNVTVENNTVVVVPVTRMYAKVKIQASFAASDMVLYDADITGIPWYCKVTPLAGDVDPSNGELQAVPFPEGTDMTSQAFSSLDAITENNGEKWLVMYIPENIRGEVNDADKSTHQNIPENALTVKIKAKLEGADYFFTVYPGENTTNNFNVRRNCVYRVSLDVRNVSEQHNPSSNCFIVKPNDILSFEPYNRVETGGGFRIEDYLTPNEEAKKIEKVEIVWQTKDCIGDNTAGDLVYLGPPTDQEKHRKIIVHTQKEGNALIAARNKAGEIVWSWHIWVTPNEPDNLGNAVPYTTYKWGKTSQVIQVKVDSNWVEPTNPWFGRGHWEYTYKDSVVEGIYPMSEEPRIPGYAVMNCNLGALEMYGRDDYLFERDALRPFPEEIYRTFGMVYQWGRKDPFPPARCYTGGNYDEGFNPHPGYLDYTTEFTEPHFANDNTTVVEKTAGPPLGAEYLFYSIYNRELESQSGIDYSIKNPTVFIAATMEMIVTDPKYGEPPHDLSNRGDWLPEGQSNDELWGGLTPNENQLRMYMGTDADGQEIYMYDNYGDKKSVFDPCPTGWRVPSCDLWLGFTETGGNPENFGIKSSEELWQLTPDQQKRIFEMPDVNWLREESGSCGMLMFMQAWRKGPVSYFPLQGTRIGCGYYFSNGYCGNYHNATCSKGNRVNILHLHQNAYRFHLFEIENREYYIKSTASPIRCVRDIK